MSKIWASDYYIPKLGIPIFLLNFELLRMTVVINMNVFTFTFVTLNSIEMFSLHTKLVDQSYYIKHSVFVKLHLKTTYLSYSYTVNF